MAKSRELRLRSPVHICSVLNVGPVFGTLRLMVMMEMAVKMATATESRTDVGTGGRKGGKGGRRD